MRTLKYTTLAILLSAGAAFAADSAAPEVVLANDNFEKRWSWTGFTAGLEAGYSWQTDATLAGPCFNVQCAAEGDGDVYGVFAGYNHQFDNFVVGAEISYTDHKVLFTDGSGVSVKDALALKARLGYSYDRFQVYALLGGVYGTTEAPPALSVLAQSDWGVVYGAGVDVGITENIFAGLQYTHQQYKTFADLPIDADVDLVTLRLGYKF